MTSKQTLLPLKSTSFWQVSAAKDSPDWTLLCCLWGVLCIDAHAMATIVGHLQRTVLRGQKYVLQLDWGPQLTPIRHMGVANNKSEFTNGNGMARPALGINFYILSHRLPNTRAVWATVRATALLSTPTLTLFTPLFRGCQRTMQLKRRMQNAKPKNAKCKTQTQSKNLPNAKWNQQLSGCKKGSVSLTHTHT